MIVIMTVGEMLKWSSETREVAEEAARMADGMALSPSESLGVKAAVELQYKRAAWLDQLALARMEMEEESNGQIS